jgi:rifampicin phosphotransferase
MELYRKPFDSMRWEEIWDVSLRIRNMFLKTPLPEVLRESLLPDLESRFEKTPVSVRSSAPGEDSSRTSFAGLHESFVNIRGAEFILERVRLVWASLWSDRALLYRKELKLDPDTSAMAVVVQKMIFGRCSGVIFGRSPVHDKQAVIEAVHGLNQGLVDGAIEPDRWILKRETGRILEHYPAQREKYMAAGRQGTAIKKLPRALGDRPPIDGHEAFKIYELAMKAESLFGCSQDVEWTCQRKILHTLQARPITTPVSSKDERSWYLSLHRSPENLKSLRVKIEENHIPGMEKAALEMSRLDLADLSDAALAREIRGRRETYEKWRQAYWDDCIPFAHGMRLFGRIYNDLVKSHDPFQFMALLEGASMISTQRNRMLEGLAAMIGKDPASKSCILEGKWDQCNLAILQACDRILDEFSDLVWDKENPVRDRSRFLQIALQMAELPTKKKRAKDQSAAFLQRRYFARFGPGQKRYARELLDLARASYRLRDDNTIFLGKIENQLLASVTEGSRRIHARSRPSGKAPVDDVLKKALPAESSLSEARHKKTGKTESGGFSLKSRQIVGQPAGAGIAVGKARVIVQTSDLYSLQRGEILVCDAIDPGMTFVVPLAAAIVERRGGMLIHGAIIAREYGLPCVTGVPDAAELIQTGDFVTVDGHLGIVTIGKPTLREE